MKIIKKASGKQQIKISKKEWQNIGKIAGWTKEAQEHDIDWFIMNRPEVVSHTIIYSRDPKEVAEAKQKLIETIKKNPNYSNYLPGLHKAELLKDPEIAAVLQPNQP